MSAHITITCDACGKQEEISNRTNVDHAINASLGAKGWQQVTYDYGGAELSELRCPDCHLRPLLLPHDDAPITREPAYDHA